jgi:TonB-linked SusC/RagA family outer membrane protein
MKKIRINDFCINKKRNFTLFLILFLASGLAYGQNQTIKLPSKKVTVQTMVQAITRQTDLSVDYSPSILNPQTIIKTKSTKMALSSLLNTALDGKDLEYEIEGRHIIIKKADTRTNSKPASGTTKRISGMVKDEKGEAIIGASVVIAGTTKGSITDIDGRFSFEGPSNGTLDVSYVGYQKQQISINNKSSFDIVLREDTKALDELVVVGYGTMKKKDLTGAVGAVKGDELSARHVTQLSTALQGATSGVTVTRTGGTPGATASIKVRGVTTISDTSPLVIVDGVPGDINQVNPNDVESVSVLKDAASASIYGSRAAAGVILITTKRAKTDEVSFNYNYEYGIEKATALPKYVGVQRFLEMTNETRYNDNNTGGWYQAYSEDLVNNWVANNATDPDKYPNVDWMDVLYKKSAGQQTHTLTMTGGGKIVRSKASFRYDDNGGLYENKNYERYMFKSNNDFNINKYIQGHLDFNFTRALTQSPIINPYGPTFSRIPPIYAEKWSNGMWGDVKDGSNVKAMLADGGNAKYWSNRISGKAELDFTPYEGLKVSAVVAPTYNFNKNKIFRKSIPYTYAGDPNTIKGYMYSFNTTKLTEDRNDDYNITTQFFANYAKSFGKHDISAMAGYEDYYAFWENLSASRDQYVLQNYPYLNLGPQDYRDNSGSAYEYAYRSFFGRFTYGYMDKYLFQANIRRDGSSRFYKDNRWASFPSFSAGWVISEEKFMKSFNWLTNLKLRASWGRLGNERIGDYYPYQSTIGFGSSLLMNGSDVVSVTGAAQSTYAVQDISWETTETWDVGLDASFFNNRLSFTGDFYRKDTKDMLLALEIPQFMGFSNPSVNAGKMHTTGYDLQANWRDNIGEFNYSIGLNFSDFVSKMGDLNGTEFLGDQVKKEGSEFNEWYGYKSDGLFLTQDDVDNSPKLNKNVKVGDVKLKDISGPDGVPDGKISPEYDRVLLGGSLPRYMFGANFNAAYKGLDFTMILQGVGSVNSRIDANMIQGLGANWQAFPKILDGNYWSASNTDEQNAAVRYPRLTYSNASSNLTMSDFWLFNGRYLRIKNLTFGYTIPSLLTKKAGIQSLRLYVTGNDLFCLSGFPEGWDPERGSNDYPITKSLIFGLSVNF